MQASSAISFRLPPASISAAASSGSPLSFRFRFPTFSRLDFPRPIAASRQLSDPRCFRFLSSASVLGSDYSASALPFLLFPVLPRSSFPGARFRSRFLGFPVLSCLISHAFLPGSCTRLSVCFLSSYPASLPQPFHWCLPSAYAFGLFPVNFTFFRPLHRRSDYSASALSFPFFPVSPRSGSSRCPFIRFPFRLFPCFPFSFGTQPSVLPFSCLRLASQRLPRSPWLTFRLSLFPIVNTLGSGYLA